jgi:hypothetical protein
MPIAVRRSVPEIPIMSILMKAMLRKRRIRPGRDNSGPSMRIPAAATAIAAVVAFPAMAAVLLVLG